MARQRFPRQLVHIFNYLFILPLLILCVIIAMQQDCFGEKVQKNYTKFQNIKKSNF